MSSEKQGATYHGHKRAFLKGDWVYVTQLPEYDHRVGQIDEIRDSLLPYLVRFDNGEQYGAFDWLALTPAARSGEVWHLRIGEGRTACGAVGHSELYASELDDVTCGACFQAVARETTGEHFFHKLGDDLYQDWADPEFPLTAGQAADWASRDPESYFAAVRADAEARAAEHMDAKHRAMMPAWGPTPGELGVALGIMAFIILLFVFFVLFYRGW